MTMIRANASAVHMSMQDPAERRRSSLLSSLTVALALCGAALTTGCVVAPSTTSAPNASDIARMSEEAVKTCGAGQVREVNAKSFSCK